MYFYLYVCPYAPRGQRCPELELHVVMSYLMRVLGAESGPLQEQCTEQYALFTPEPCLQPHGS